MHAPGGNKLFTKAQAAHKPSAVPLGVRQHQAAELLSNVYELACNAAAKQPQGQLARAMEIAAARSAASQPQGQTTPSASAGTGYVTPSPPSCSQVVDALPASDEIPQP